MEGKNTQHKQSAGRKSLKGGKTRHDAGTKKTGGKSRFPPPVTQTEWFRY